MTSADAFCGMKHLRMFMAYLIQLNIKVSFNNDSILTITLYEAEINNNNFPILDTIRQFEW